MTETDTLKKEIAAYDRGPLADVKIQEALTIVAIYAAQLDYRNCAAEVKRIEALLERHEWFVARKKEIFSMINKFVNEMEARGPDKALATAADALTAEQKRNAFELAVSVALPDKQLSPDKQEMLATLQERLAVDRDLAAAVIRAQTGN
jgi:hypothetical protein